MGQGKNVIYQLSKCFALRIVRLYCCLRDNRGEYVISKQLYRSGTSIGANIAESIYAQSDADYISKLSIALKEASETEYWLDLLYESEVISEKENNSLVTDLKTIIGTLINIINKIKNKKREDK